MIGQRLMNCAPGTYTSRIPGRASDAGPASTGEPMDWRDYLEDAIDDLQTALRLYRDDPAAERKLRLERIGHAVERCSDATKHLPSRAAVVVELATEDDLEMARRLR